MSKKRFFIIPIGLLLTFSSATAVPCPQCSDDDNGNQNKTREKECLDSIDNRTAAILVGDALLDYCETLRNSSNPLIYLFGGTTDENDKNSNITQYKIQRGESLEDIIKQYDITEDELKSLNPDMEFFYTGMIINIPVKAKSGTASTLSDPAVLASNSSSASATNTTSSGNSVLMEIYNSDVKRADHLLEIEEYKKANKSYTEIIKNYSGIFKCGEAYYGRALAAYNRKKWKSAIKDFEAAIADNELRNSSREHCEKLLTEARKFREEQLEQRGEIWAGILQTGVGIAAGVMAAHEAEKQQRAAMSSSSSGNSSGYESSSDTSDYTSSSSSSTTTGGNSKEFCPSIKANSGKWYCAGSGKCGMCNGDGLMDGSYGQGPNSHKCTLCNGSGVCKYCHGSGHG